MRYVVCFGDSLTEFGFRSGWLSRLADAYVRKATVVNCGLSGYNSKWYLDVLTHPEKRVQMLPDHVRSPLFATLLLGSNDLATNEQGIPLEQYVENMSAILKFIHEEVRPKYGIFLMTPPPVHESLWALTKQTEVTNRSLADSRIYRRAVMDLAADLKKNHPEMHVHLVDLHSAILHYANPATAADEALDPTWEPVYDPQAPWTRLLEDGLHVGEVGGDIFYNALVEAIRGSVHAAALDPEALPWPLPDRLVLIAEEQQRRLKEGAGEEEERR